MLLLYQAMSSLKRGSTQKWKLVKSKYFAPSFSCEHPFFLKMFLILPGAVPGKIFCHPDQYYFPIHLCIWLAGYRVYSIILVRGWQNTGLRMTKYWSADDKILVRGWQSTGPRMTKYWSEDDKILVHGWHITGPEMLPEDLKQFWVKWMLTAG